MLNRPTTWTRAVAAVTAGDPREAVRIVTADAPVAAAAMIEALEMIGGGYDR